MNNKIKIISTIICIVLAISILLGTIDYSRVKYGMNPLFMIRVTSGEKLIHHYIGIGYRIERKVTVSYDQPFDTSEYVKFGSWIYTSNVDIVKASPEYIYIKTNDQEVKANMGSYCWTNKKLSVCSDTIGPTQMEYIDTLKTTINEPITVENSYGRITNVKAYQIDETTKNKLEEIPKEINIESTEKIIISPQDKGIYYISINIEASEGTVWHSFKLQVIE